jgi:hypothetical protein
MNLPVSSWAAAEASKPQIGGSYWPQTFFGGITNLQTIAAISLRIHQVNRALWTEGYGQY